MWNPEDWSFNSYTGHDGPVTSVCARGGCVYTGSVDMSVHQWILGKQSLIHKFEGHTQEVATAHSMFTHGLPSSSLWTPILESLLLLVS